MKEIACDTENNECMVHRCQNCPGTDALQEFISSQIGIDNEDEMYIEQWQTTDRSTLITQTNTFEEYKELLISCIDKLTSHSYIAKCQGRYLKNLKEHLVSDQCIIRKL